MMDDLSNCIIEGDSFAVLRTLPDNCVQCCVTSPPYYALRDYGVPGQIGLEETPAAYIEKLVQVFREVRRVLRADGVLWLNLGDSYANDRKWGGHPSGKHCEALHTMARPQRFTGLPGKNLLMIPARVALALQDDGWILRSDVIWQKPTCMPESVTDRPTTAHEHVFLFAKSEQYYYDAAAIQERSVSDHGSGNGFKRDARISYLSPDGNACGNEQPWEVVPYRNRRTVWTLPAQPYPGAHFATMPPKLVELCLLAATSPQACEHCATPWQRVMMATGYVNKREQAHVPGNCETKTDSTGWAPTRVCTDRWESGCTCAGDTGSGRCVVLDPFMGAGTVALVALEHSRRYLGIELNPAYIELANRRVETVQPRLWADGSEVA